MSILTPHSGNRNNKPEGTPRNWPNSTESDLAACPSRHVKVNLEQSFQFVTNNVKTSKYEWYNFLPKFLLEEFNPKVKVANCYFLMISGLQCIPIISNTYGLPTTLIPLSFVVVINAVFQILEDLTRHRADREANSSVTLRLEGQSKEFREIRWSELLVGDIVKVECRSQVPADLLILSVSERVPTAPTGICYVETKSLDGETNLKLRNAMPATLSWANDAENLLSLRGHVDMEHPNKLIDSFTGVLDLSSCDDPHVNESNVRTPILASNLLLRGCVLRNSDYIYGLVLNTGAHTKIMMSNTKTKPKSSSLDNKSSSMISSIIALLALVCFAGATGQAVWNTVHDVKEIWYLDWDPSPVGYWFIKFFYFFLLHASFIPVSLYVSMSIVRFYQSTFMNADLEMYYADIDQPAAVRTMTLNEELGQISHIFSDKTGTLTCNIMEFRKLSVGGKVYGLGYTEIGRAAWKLLGKGTGGDLPEEVLQAQLIARQRAVPHVAFYDPLLERHFCISSLSDSASSLGGPSNPSPPSSAPHASGGRGDELPSEILPQGNTTPRLGSSALASGNRTTEEIEQCKLIHEYFRVLSMCHDVIAENLNGKVKLSASSPDDQALVCAAAYFGYRFTDRREGKIHIMVGDSEFENQLNKLSSAAKLKQEQNESNGAAVESDGRPLSRRSVVMSVEETVDVLNIIEFSSKRKRMSVIIRDRDGRLKLMMKGADTTMMERLRRPENASSSSSNSVEDNLVATTMKQLVAFSDEGLRCLLVGSCVLDEEVYEKWSTRYTAARSDMAEIDKKKRGEANLIEDLEDEIERGVVLLGVTAIEDRLQDGVPECMASLAQAGIKIWMLTGDKEETAINIGVACSLLLPTEHMRHVVINRSTAPTSQAVLDLFERETKLCLAGDAQSAMPRALIVDGPSLIAIMANPAPRQAILDFTQRCVAVVGCRVSPDQKREMVNLIKLGVPGVRTLAVGDGANDVAMIQEAHVGVGIRGEEGLQAVNAADYSISQFRFLKPLLLKHGRYNYIRMCNVVNFMFYKNILASMGNFWFNFNCAFTGQKYYTEGAIQLFNLFFTSVPILLCCVYDMDVNPKYSTELYPQMYSYCVKNGYFNAPIFYAWIVNAFAESVFLSVLPLYLLQNSELSGGADGHPAAGALCVTAIIIAVNMKLFYMQSRWNFMHVLVILISILSWFIVAFIITFSTSIDYDFFAVWTHLMVNGTFWMSLLFLVVAVNVKDLFISAVLRQFFCTADQIVQEIDVYGDKATIPAGYGNLNTDDKVLDTDQKQPQPSPVQVQVDQQRDLVRSIHEGDDDEEVGFQHAKPHRGAYEAVSGNNQSGGGASSGGEGIELSRRSHGENVAASALASSGGSNGRLVISTDAAILLPGTTTTFIDSDHQVVTEVAGGSLTASLERRNASPLFNDNSQISTGAGDRRGSAGTNTVA